jgi:hypothetical protein
MAWIILERMRSSWSPLTYDTSCSRLGWLPQLVRSLSRRFDKDIALALDLVLALPCGLFYYRLGDSHAHLFSPFFATSDPFRQILRWNVCWQTEQTKGQLQEFSTIDPQCHSLDIGILSSIPCSSLAWIWWQGNDYHVSGWVFPTEFLPLVPDLCSKLYCICTPHFLHSRVQVKDTVTLRWDKDTIDLESESRLSCWKNCKTFQVASHGVKYKLFNACSPRTIP